MRYLHGLCIHGTEFNRSVNRLGMFKPCLVFRTCFSGRLNGQPMFMAVQANNMGHIWPTPFTDPVLKTLAYHYHHLHFLPDLFLLFVLHFLSSPRFLLIFIVFVFLSFPPLSPIDSTSHLLLLLFLFILLRLIFLLFSPAPFFFSPLRFHFLHRLFCHFSSSYCSSVYFTSLSVLFIE